MGVFARLLRRSKATEEGSTAEAQAAPETAEAAAEQVVVGEATVADPTGSTDGTAAKEAEDAEVAAETEAEGSAGAEAVEIPKQQSAEKAADSGAGEGART
ncbi:hypothetical protein [Streptomyces sp. NPDC005423]|uniref:hypothetical protein n=1 Tax=Streptomyces sp. NPDC005423 TaxID=3155343 RepID=UPI0033B3D2CF